MGRPRLIKVDITDGRGLGGAKTKTVTVKTRIPDILAFRDSPIFPYLLMSANPKTPVPVLRTVLEAVGPHQKRSATWFYKRKVLLEVPVIPPGVDPQVVDFVEANMKLSALTLRAKLRKRGFNMSIDKVYRIWMAISHSNAME